MKSLYKKIKSIVTNDSGSAIIMALIIIAGLAGTGLGAARLSRSNISQTNQFEDSLKAFYAAEAGVEAAFLEWRFDHDVEFWDQEAANDCYEGQTDRCLDATPARYVTLDDQTSSFTGQDLVRNLSEEDVEAGVVPKNQAWYELRIYYRDPENPFLGTYIGGFPYDTSEFYPTKGDLPRIAKDETLEIRFPKHDQVKGFDIKWASDGIQNTGDEFVQLIIHPVADDGAGNSVLAQIGNRPYYSNKVEYNNNVDVSYFVRNIEDYGYDLVSSIRIKCLTNNENGGAIIAFRAFDDLANNINVPLDVITIESIGHYNDVERKIIYEIDRESGTIMDIFDHGVFSEQTLRK